MAKRIILLFGGESREWMVSVASAQNLATQIENPICWFWNPNGQIYQVSIESLLAHQNPFNTPFEPKTPAMFTSLDKALDSQNPQETIFVLGVHGIKSEDGFLQGMLEKRGFAFTGSSAKASALAFDKVKSIEVLKRAGILVPDGQVISAQEREDAPKILASFLEKYPKAILKPVADGSSVGLVVLEGYHSIPAAIMELTKDPGVDYLLENWVEGRELTVGVIDSPKGLFALPCTEIVKEIGRNFDYEGKYLGAGIQEVTPAKVTAELSSLAQDVALRAHRELGCRGYSRTDVLMSKDGPVFLELNTLPGLTKASLVPQQLQAAHISLKDFINQQLQIATKSAIRA